MSRGGCVVSRFRGKDGGWAAGNGRGARLQPVIYCGIIFAPQMGRPKVVSDPLPKSEACHVLENLPLTR